MMDHDLAEGPKLTVDVSLPRVTPAEADLLASDLYDELQQQIPEVSVDRSRADSLTQDFGATLVLVLGAPSVIVLARGLAKWLTRHQDAYLHLKRTARNGDTREVTVGGQTTDAAAQVIREFFED